jgi:hypothetical protein
VLRLFVIAVVSLASFFVFVGILYRITRNNEIAAWSALALGFLGTPIVLLRVWRGSNASAKCPGGKGLYPECMFVATVSESEISVQRPDGTVNSFPISKLQEVAIVTNDSGPIGADVWWVLSDSPNTGLTFPGGATGEQEILEFVQKLPGFDNERLIQSMGSTSNARFVCWSAVV